MQCYLSPFPLSRPIALLYRKSRVDSFVFSVDGNTDYNRGFPFLVCIIATDMEKNLESVLFHFRFGFSVIIIRVMRLDVMITSLTLFPIGRLKVKLASYKRLT